MFDQYSFKASVHHHEHEAGTVIHQRAPTDKSVELLREFEQKARDKIIASFPVEYSGIKTTWYIEQTQSIWEEKVVVRCRVHLGDKVHDFELETIAMEELKHTTQSTLAMRLKKILAEHIAEKLMINALIDEGRKRTVPFNSLSRMFGQCNQYALKQS